MKRAITEFLPPEALLQLQSSKAKSMPNVSEHQPVISVQHLFLVLCKEMETSFLGHYSAKKHVMDQVDGMFSANCCKCDR